MNPGYEADQAENDKVPRSLVYIAQLGAGANRLFLVPSDFMHRTSPAAWYARSCKSAVGTEKHLAVLLGRFSLFLCYGDWPGCLLTVYPSKLPSFSAHVP